MTEVPERENLIFMHDGAMIGLYILFAISLAIMLWGFWQRIKIYKMGRKAPHLPSFWQGLKDVAALALGQSKTRKKPIFGPAHSAIFYGFVVLFIGTTLVAIDMDIARPLFGVAFLSGQFYLWFELFLDVFGVLFIAGILVMAWRRTFIKPKSLKTRLTDKYALWIFGIIGITGYALTALRIHIQPNPFVQWNAISYHLAPIYSLLNVPTGAENAGVHLYWGIWWFHAVLVFIFIALIPFTKLVHIFTTTTNVATQTQRVAPGRLSKPFDLMELVEKGEFEFEMGIEKPADLTWKQLVMADSCTNCGRCEDECPATAAGRPLSPRVLIQDLNHASFAGAPVPPAFGRDASEGPGAMGQEAWTEYETACRKDRGDGKPVGHQPILGNVVQHDTLWACTTCRACEQACPVQIEHVGIIMDMRRQLTLQGDVKKHQREMIEKTATAKNPWGLPASERMEWAKGLEKIGVKVHELSELGSAKDLDVVFWVGCSGASDPRNRSISQAMAKILDHAGLKWAVLGKEETCTGDPARRIGEEGRYQELAFENIAKFDAYEIKNVVTTCPHCFNTLKNEYPDFGWKDANVVHHTQFIEELLSKGMIKPEVDPGIGEIAYHDSCYIGRHNGIFDAPRKVLESLPGVTVKEAKKSREAGRCCGAGGSNMWYEVEEADRMSNIRMRELADTGAKTIASNCPFCMTMFQDAKANVDENLKTQDLAELVAMSLSMNGVKNGGSAPKAEDVEDKDKDAAS
jgi:Fe-S oxidoreductase/nitrate reductase gamma subunit